jgi:hypothetical protein
MVWYLNPLKYVWNWLKGLVQFPYIWLTGILNAVLTIPQAISLTITQTVNKFSNELTAAVNKTEAAVEASIMRVGFGFGGFVVVALLLLWSFRSYVLLEGLSVVLGLLVLLAVFAYFTQKQLCAALSLPAETLYGNARIAAQLLLEGAVVESRAPARRKQARGNVPVSKDDAPGLNAE